MFCNIRKWRKLLDVEDHLRYRTEYDHSADGKPFCHPEPVLRALSRARKDDSISKVMRDATIAIDVGDVTLVRGTIFRCFTYFMHEQS